MPVIPALGGLRQEDLKFPNSHNVKKKIIMEMLPFTLPLSLINSMLGRDRIDQHVEELS
jgi:hypothetical protein